MSTAKTITYHYRGTFLKRDWYGKRGHGLRHCEGYSINEGDELMTKRECQRAARQAGAKAVFVDEPPDVKPELIHFGGRGRWRNY